MHDTQVLGLVVLIGPLAITMVAVAVVTIYQKKRGLQQQAPRSQQATLHYKRHYP